MSGQYNVVLVVLDTLRKDALPPFNRSITHPFLSEFRNQCFSYDNAVSPSSWTIPAHASMFTGKYSSKSGVKESTEGVPDYSKLFGDYAGDTLAERMKKIGYQTCAFSQNVLIGPDTSFSRGFDLFRYTENEFYEHFFRMQRRYAHITDTWGSSIGQVLKSKHKVEFVREYLELKKDTRWLKEFDTVKKGGMEALDSFAGVSLKEPFFLFFNFMEMHEPLGSGSLRIGWEDSIFAPEKFGENLRKEVRDTYYSKANYLGELLSRLMQDLNRRGVLENTVVIVTSDHGQGLFDYRDYYGHTNFTHPNLVEVPLLMRFPYEVKFTQNQGYQSLTKFYDFIPMVAEEKIDYDYLTTSTAACEVYGTFDRDIPKYKNMPGFDKTFETVNRIRKAVYKGNHRISVDLSTGKIEDLFENGSEIPLSGNEDIVDDLLQEIKNLSWGEKLKFPEPTVKSASP